MTPIAFECVLTAVDRQTGFDQVAKIRHRTAREVTAALGPIIAAHPAWFKTITFDNGTEFHSYKKLERRFGVLCYFAVPHHPWERGSNENFNGLLRQYLPKGESMAYVGNTKLAGFCRQLNTRPRKRHGFYQRQDHKLRQYFTNAYGRLAELYTERVLADAFPKKNWRAVPRVEGEKSAD